MEYVRMIALGTEYFRVDDHRPDSPDFMALTDLGAVQSNTVNFEQTENEIDLETIVNYDGDIILMGGNYLGTPEEESAAPVVLDLLANTHAGQLGQIFLVETAVWGFPTTHNLMRVLDDLERIVSENELDVSGDFR
jgi:ABC-type Fe3+-hydroxamate transport system substrate-binding protein